MIWLVGLVSTKTQVGCLRLKWGPLGQCSTPVSDSGFLPAQVLEGNSNGASNCVPATYVENLD